jgi:hypothetical protein
MSVPVLPLPEESVATMPLVSLNAQCPTRPTVGVPGDVGVLVDVALTFKLTDVALLTLPAVPFTVSE